MEPLSSGSRDTWWMGLCQRFQWPADFQQLTADRAAKGFTVVQIVAGLYPDMPAFDPRGANEAGFPWEKDYARINPAYFDMADLRIQHLVEPRPGSVHRRLLGILPSVDGRRENEASLALSGRPLGRLPGRLVPRRRGHHALLSIHRPRNATRAEQKQGWTELARYVRSVDPYHRLITIHPSRSARDCV